jgi:uncharacterized protein YutE (UPF0331/DUF86 family)
MVDSLMICRKVKQLAGYFREFEQTVAGLTMETYQNQILTKRAVEREIQLIVECATDINNMILKKIGKGPARDYFNSFLDLAENQVLEMDFALKIAPSTGLRNILIHEYEKIDDGIVFQSIANILTYYLQYLKTISEYLGC